MLYSSVVIRISFSNVSQIHTCTHTSSLLSHVCAWLALLTCSLPACLLSAATAEYRFATEPNRATHSLYTDGVRQHSFPSHSQKLQSFSTGIFPWFLTNFNSVETCARSSRKSVFYFVVFWVFVLSHRTTQTTMTYTIINGYKKIIWVENQKKKKLTERKTQTKEEK